MNLKKKISPTDALWGITSVMALIALLAFMGFQPQNSPADDIEDVNEVIDKFQEAYTGSELNDLRNLFVADAVIATDGSGGSRQSVYCLEEWLENTQEYVFDENEYISDVLSNREIQVFRNIAYAVCEYNYVCDDKSGQGIDVLTFIKIRDRWRIVSLQFTGDENTRD